MKQKVMIKVSMNDQKSRSKALRILVGASGVESAALKGDDKSQIEVTGDGFDPTALTLLLRKKLGRPDLVSVEEKNEDEADNDDSDDRDNNGGGGDKNKKKGGGSGDGEGNGDGGDKADGGDGEEKGMNKDCTGQLGFGYRCTYHAGYENGYPVEQLHALIMFYLFCSENMMNYCSIMPPVRDVSLMIWA